MSVEIFFRADIVAPVPGQEFDVDIFLAPGDEALNALEGTLHFSGDRLSVKEIREHASIVSFWIDPPTLRGNDEITFSGIVPGGYTGTEGLVLSVTFVPLDVGTAEISADDVRVFAHDGSGSSSQVFAQSLVLEVQPSGEVAVSSIADDIDAAPPEDFLPEITRTDSVFAGDWFLVFSTKDKGSGIAYYMVQEGGRPPVVAESPYRLRGQGLRGDIIVSAFDAHDNVRTITIPAPQPWPESMVLLAWAVLIVGVAALVGGIIRKLSRK